MIGCPHSRDRWSIRVGVTAETLMRRATCPVMLVGAAYTPSKLTADAASAGPLGAEGPVVIVR